MVVLDATVGGANSNSYSTDAEIDSVLLEERIYGTAWSSLVVDDKKRVAIWGTLLLDSSFDLFGSKATTLQALRFPRVGLVNEDGETIASNINPPRLKKALAEMCLSLARRDRGEEPEVIGQGFKFAKIDVLEVQVDSSQLLNIIPHSVAALMAIFGTPKPSSTQGGGMVRLSRA